MNQDAMERAILIVGGAVCALLVLGIGFACIAGPLTGHWEPDIALGFWLLLGGITYGVYRLVK